MIRVQIPSRVLVIAISAAAAWSAPAAPLGTGKLVAKQIVTALARPVFVTSPPGDADRLFIVERYFGTGTGRIRIFEQTTQSLLGTSFLEIPGVNTGGEEGLLGLAFHPNYASNGHFFVCFSDTIGSRMSRIVRYTANAPFATSTTADAASATEVLRVIQPQANHNGGWIGFNPVASDNQMTTGNPRHYLYISTGDGGGGNDNNLFGHTAGLGNGQDITNNLLGKILRLDTGADGDADDFPADTLRHYAIPPDNPFVGLTGDDEIWSYGLRNPWRCSFDRVTGDFWIGDVGQNNREEISFQPTADFTAVDPLAANFGWRNREGDLSTPTGGVGGILPGSLPARDGIPAGQFAPGTGNLMEPVLDYIRGTSTDPNDFTDNGSQFYGWSVTGGCVYRGSIQWLQGAYFFGDYASNRFYSIRVNGNTITEKLRWDPSFDNLVLDPPAANFINFASISEGGDGELYICTHLNNDTGGGVLVLTQKPFFRYRSTYFTEAELNDESVSNPDANEDGDEWTVAEEFALNTDPTVANGDPWTIGIENTGGLDDFFTFTLEVSPEAKEVVNYTGESGCTLGDFDPANATTGFEPATGTTLKVRDKTPVSTAERRFIFLGFDIPPAELSE